MQAIMDVGRPDACHEEEQLKSKGVHGYVEEGPAVGDGLQNAIQRMEGQTRKWRQTVLLVILVVNEMEPPACAS